MNAYEMVKKTEKSVRNVTSFVPDIAIVLGSGLGALADEVKAECVLSAAEMEGYPVSTVSGHNGKLIFGYLEGKKVVVQQGRIHYYEGYSMEQVVLPIRLMCALGAETVILTNAAGGINPTFDAGDFMIIDGQISTFVPSPLIGPNDERFGTRFPDMSEVYSERGRALLDRTAKELGLRNVKHGVYLQTTGPNYESPEEVRAFKTLGADAVGMSTTVEAIAARHMGREVLGVSLISNPAAGISDRPLTHEEVKEAGERASRDLTRYVAAVVRNL